MMQLQPEDFYFDENNLLVFTATYHLKRGYCCQSGCRHCPFGFRTANREETTNNQQEKGNPLGQRDLTENEAP